MGANVLMPPTVKTKPLWLVVTAHLSDYLPNMDLPDPASALLGGEGGIDAYYR